MLGFNVNGFKWVCWAVVYLVWLGIG
ncbi:hypothetical protein F383_37202 [Gossypium arboreum]|uniref:Uncharacterized protein n=1 Tax=Gossypium arboreum TaxID=29729 RepID=A0A0B0MBE7_GOSAR|nr:hypothetical protein F383_37202 [Gossypium arboreum]